MCNRNTYFYDDLKDVVEISKKKNNYICKLYFTNHFINVISYGIFMILFFKECLIQSKYIIIN